MICPDKIDYSLLEKSDVIKILAVEDDVSSMAFLASQIEALGHQILEAKTGQDAITILEKNAPEIDVILMNKETPVMDGLTAVQRIKDNPDLRNIPVIMLSNTDTVEEMRQGLDAGVFYYLSKPVDKEMFQSVLSAAVREAIQAKTLSHELSQHKASFDLIKTAKFEFKTLNEAESLAAFIANCFPEPERVLTGIGELLMNAIEHGKLGITYEQKTEFVASGTWRAEVERLQSLPEFVDKIAFATVAHKDEGTYFIVEDPGDGFAWKKFMTIDPARAGDNHGRGIAQANSISFDNLTYNEKGNQAIAFVSNTRKLDW